MRIRLSRVPIARLLLAVALSAVAAPACGYDPNPESGTLLCGPLSSCPDDYRCVNQLCWRNEDVPGACGTTTTEKLIGHWVFVPPSRRLIVCTDGFTDDDTAWTDYFDVETGGSAALRSFYYCDLDLDISAAGSTILRPSGSCSAQDPIDPTVTFTWTPTTFTLSTTTGCSGTLTASIPYSASNQTASVACTMDFMGTLTKN
jgi:hypothetical protein